jgi:hypothetical protein
LDSSTAQQSVKRPRGRPRKVQPKRTFVKYGYEWPLGTGDLDIELYCFRRGHPVELGGLGKAGHYKEAVALLWGPHNDRIQFKWTPWGDRKLEASCKHKYLAVSGCANSEKSDFYAVWGIINFLCAPIETMVLITSTSLKESRGRIWGRVEDYWLGAQHVCGGALPGKLVSSIGMIRFEDPTGEFKTSDRCGIHLIAGEKKKEKESIGKMIGLKNQRVFFIADELPELSHAILEAAFSNLASNPEFQLIGTGNPSSIYDPHGVLSKPKGGWASVTPNDEEWETEKGYHIRFDALKSPNVLAGRTIYPWLPTQAKIDNAMRDTGGEDSFAFWRMWRGYWCPNGSTETVVSEADIIKFGCEETEVKWKTQPMVVLTSLDPSFTSGGDKSVRTVAEFGEDHTGKMVLLFKKQEPLYEDITKKDQPRNFQIAQQFKAKSEADHISPDRAAVDDTGAAAFGDIVHVVWDRRVVRVNFGGKASERPVSAENKQTRACEVYANRVTELWCSIRAFMRAGQIRGISPDLGQELTSRKMKHIKSGAVLKQQVETKEDMRARTGKSPDAADSALILLELARSKFHFRPAGKNNAPVNERRNWKSFVQRMGSLSNVVTLDRAA